MDYHKGDVVVRRVVIGIICLLIGFIVGNLSNRESRYKQGQIDAINNEIHYELQVQEDNETIWIKK